MKRLGLLLAAVVLFAGCATSLEDLRKQEPRRAGIAASDFRTLARCVADRLREAKPEKKWPYPVFELAELPDQDHITGLGSRKLFLLVPVGTPIPNMDLRFAPDPKGVLVEARGGADSEAAWPLVEKCAGAKVVETPR